MCNCFDSCRSTDTVSYTHLDVYKRQDVLNPAFTAGTQWFERTLDDSANKRISVAEAFLAADAILNIMINVTSGMVVYPKIVRKRVMAELPFMATENIMMDAVKKGGDRQALHEKIRQYSMEAGKKVKEEGLENDLCERILADPMFMITKEEMDAIMAVSYTHLIIFPGILTKTCHII